MKNNVFKLEPIEIIHKTNIMFYEELTSSLMIVDDHKYELIEHDGIEGNYYAVQRDDGYADQGDRGPAGSASGSDSVLRRDQRLEPRDCHPENAQVASPLLIRAGLLNDRSRSARP